MATIISKDTALDRIVKNLVIDSKGCWIWQGYYASEGYPKMSWKSKGTLVHRVVYTVCKGSIPAGEVVRHLCHNRRCVNPSHLEKGTHADNALDSINGAVYPATTNNEWPLQIS